MIHNEDALSRTLSFNTDYSQASVEQMRNEVKMQMANNVIGKSMRMNDSPIDLTNLITVLPKYAERKGLTTALPYRER